MVLPQVRGFTLDMLRDGWYKVTELEPAAGFTIKEPATQEVYSRIPG